MIRSFWSNALRKFWERGEVRSVPTDWTEKIEKLLDLLDKARAPEDMALPGLFYSYPEGTKGRFAIHVSKGWRLTFGWKNGEAVEVDLEELH
jgi:proteic killer suppression protein